MMATHIIKDANEEYDYIFGFGSIINTSTHAPWLSSASSKEALTGRQATVQSCFGYRRGWNFRSSTGFTALGVVKVQEGSAINGVVFQIPRSALSDFDRREVGYDRVEIPQTDLLLEQSTKDEPEAFVFHPSDKIWMYVPQASYCATADEDHPILQSYVDTVLQGCLEWGGEAMARTFVATTHDWSPYFLNDTPSSRRPWLFRKQYDIIDGILREHSAVTYFTERRHPEEFASAFLLKLLRGTWSLPQRNTAFAGREEELRRMHAKLTNQTGIAMLEVTGMGGVGKTQICIEYCYRNYPSYYGLIVWIRAQESENIAASYLQFMADTTGIDVQDYKSVDEVVSDVKARLYRSKIPWLLVFDNIDDRTKMEKFLPHGGEMGHVLVTTRQQGEAVSRGGKSGTTNEVIALNCLQPGESVELLCRAANFSEETDKEAASELAEELGHLPLALTMAAAYMTRCDVSCQEYLGRYRTSRGDQLLRMGLNEAVKSSLSLSLTVIQEENLVAWEVLRLLSWLGPDEITKSLIRFLLRARTHRGVARELERQSQEATRSRFNKQLSFSSIAFLSLFAARRFFQGSRHIRVFDTAVVTTAAIGLVSALCLAGSSPDLGETDLLDKTSISSVMQRQVSYSYDEYEQSDTVWRILKSFSILAVKKSKASMHRLLAKSLQVDQGEVERRENLSICIMALEQAWTFNPDEIETWKESEALLEHAKALIRNATRGLSALDGKSSRIIGQLSTKAGIFIAMSLNRFDEAKKLFSTSLAIFESLGSTTIKHHQAEALHELGKIHRYQGEFTQAEDSLRAALSIRVALSSKDSQVRQDVASTLFELGVNEMKKHSLESASDFLRKSLTYRRSRLRDPTCERNIEGDCAATLHQLASVELARKPPALGKAEELLDEALSLKMQIGQRAATLKQLARVAIRRGDFVTAEKSLEQASELYTELYGSGSLHINVASLQFQQGTLAMQRESYDSARDYFSNCLRARQRVYAYVAGNHLEVSTVMHELARVAFFQKRLDESTDMLQAERRVLDELIDSEEADQRIFQARLTNLTWLIKCAKANHNENEARALAEIRSALKRHARKTGQTHQSLSIGDKALAEKAITCRMLVRRMALKRTIGSDLDVQELHVALESLSEQIKRSKGGSLLDSIQAFSLSVCQLIKDSKIQWPDVLKECDILRDVLRSHGVQVSDQMRQP